MKRNIVFDLQSSSIRYLRKVDELLDALILDIGTYTLNRRDNYFSSLTRIIVGQQLSIHSAKKIWHRLYETSKEISPANICKVNENALRVAGLSKSKILYIKSLADAVITGDLDLDVLEWLPNNEIIDVLTQHKGIGRWTSETFMIFSLGRLDVLPMQDMGLHRAIKWLYSLDEYPNRTQMDRLNSTWSPYQSVATLYLWEAVNRGFIKNKCLY